ncbi:hypothetical protein KUCAC02_029969 [Chaenocephalus aceratus]|uniref:Uncharacterized protein n=1 Tax=Chaenocephalus aceratus TaxID=36190 RepID=A0ACB9XI39_CHAAC|nr:hypothetical protein KUCAC02_029969 [Chaenocephalus aceratus]
MTSSHQSPGNGEVTGDRAVGGGSVENVTDDGESVEKLLSADTGDTQIETKIHVVRSGDILEMPRWKISDHQGSVWPLRSFGPLSND